MATTITMPALSPTMEEGRLAKWHVTSGDTVSAGDVLAEIETDKAIMELEAIDEGVIARLLVEAGTDGVKVNAPIAVLAEEGEDADNLPDIAVPMVSAPPVSTPDAAESTSKPTPVSVAMNAPALPHLSGEAPASPLARRLAKAAGLDLASIKGSGPEGRIVKRDVEMATRAGLGTKSPGAEMGIPALPSLLDARVYAPDSYELKPLDGVGRTVAQRLSASFMQIPHFPLSRDVCLDQLLKSRAMINQAAPEGTKISVNDILIKAAGIALKRVPDCNASYTKDGIALHKGAHVSVAIAIKGGGLMTPVVRDADRLGLIEISRQVKDFAKRAQDRRLKPHEYMGGTFSLSNLGMFGVKSFGSILNPPEGMILSVGAGRQEVVVDAQGDFAKATMMNVTLTCDHRVIGGAEGAHWLSVFAQLVEDPASMLL